MNKVKYFFSLIFFLIISIVIMGSYQVKAAIFLGNVDVHCGRVMQGGCYDCTSSYTPDQYCKATYGASAQIQLPLPGEVSHSGSSVCTLNPIGTTQMWGAASCVQLVPPTCTISLSPDSIMSGETEDITVSWTTTNATSATLNGAAVAPASLASGSQIFTGVSTAATYTLAVFGAVPAASPCVANVTIIPPPIGGIVPCGRGYDNLATPYNEKEPCTLCHIFIMLQIISTFATEISGIIAVFFLVIGGLIYATSAGNQGRMDTGKKAITWALLGLAIIFIAWLIVTIVLTALGYIDPMGGQWNIVNCTVS